MLSPLLPQELSSSLGPLADPWKPVLSVPPPLLPLDQRPLSPPSSLFPSFWAESSPLLRADAQIAVLQQRIDRLAQLNEKQAASPLEPRELEELRGKNERYGSPAALRAWCSGHALFPHCPLPRSLTVRLHEALKQCQDLKTEKSQMDRRISQLSEENGDLSFKVRVGVSGPHLEGAAELVWTVPPEG